MSQAESAERSGYLLAQLVATSRAMASERDPAKLLALILESCRRVTGADAGSVYVVEDDPAAPDQKRLRFMLSQNDSIPINFREFTLPVDESSIVGKAALSAEPINVPDLGKLREAGRTPTFSHNRSFDDKTGYRARSMLTVPMASAMGEVIGVVQLINKKRDPGRPLGADDAIPFDAVAEELAQAWVAQAGLSLEKALLYDEIPIESRIMTIADIFDALTASDRPYKKAVPVDRALGILDAEVKAGKCDPTLFRLFVEAEVYKKVL